MFLGQIRKWILAIVALGAIGFQFDTKAAAPAAPELVWAAWSDEVFARAKAENKFVLLSLQSWWCPWCHTMNEVTYTNSEVRQVMADKFIAVRVDQDNRPDISQRFERWGWPATVIFGADGTEIVKLRGFYSPQFFLPILHETIKDPTPVDYGKPGGDERAAEKMSRLSDKDRADIVAFIAKAWDEKNAGWGRSKLVDGPTYTYALEKAYLGDKDLAAKARRTIDKLPKLMEKKTGAVGQASLKPDWSEPTKEYPMFAQEGALKGLSQAYALWNDPKHLAAAKRVANFLSTTMLDANGGLYTSMGLERGNPGVDKRQYARENGLGIQGLLAFYNATGDEAALKTATAAANWVLANRARGDGGFNHAQKDAAGPYLVDTLAMGQAFLDLYRSTGERKWLAHARAAGDFIIKRFVEAETGAVVASASPDASVVLKPIKQREDNVAAVRFFNLLGAYTGEQRYRDSAETVFGYLASPAVLEAFGFLPDVLQAEYELTHEPVHVTIVGAKSDAQARALYRAALKHPSAYKRAEWWDKAEGALPNPDVNYPEYPGAAAFACTRNFCSLPVTKPQEVAAALDRLQRELP